ncbi:MAG: D-alanine--D-alanine ligase [Fimbriimonas ginsengisoli]|uniref:Multifunctional fusion protein n=1 Tax=Fimbriimonas ginsengisoli TaxID=1005039 RepID=A0A931LX22_FIMGI|nr:D-alanine--D-alanine ligase [Fimbriimonas ginsengisoli]
MRTKQEIGEAFAPREALKGARAFFLVGIGGAGMSALALMLRRRGFAVRGTDSSQSEATDALLREGIEVRIGHSGKDLRDGDAVVLSDAIALEGSPEVARTRQLGQPLFRRSQVLGWLLLGRKTIAVTGTHGKTTTTGMIGAALIAAGLDPLVVVGANVPEWGGPVVEGKGEWAVVEACEAYDSFHDLDPMLVVLTSLEADHLDYHKTYENLRESVLRFARSVPAEGALVFSMSDGGARDAGVAAGVRAVGYCGSDLPSALKLVLPGEHNRLNAAGALATAKLAGADAGRALEGIAAFKGAERRLQVLAEDLAGVTVVDDYAHHPTEIEASLKALRERYPGRRIVVAYQPHLYSRTAALIPEFAGALDGADLLLLTDIYPAREEPIPGISSARIAELCHTDVRYISSRHLLPKGAAQRAQLGDIVVGMGAGTIAEFAPAFIKLWSRRNDPSRRVRVAVVFGGDNAEREVSILSGRAIHRALLLKGYESRLVDISEMLLSSGDLTSLVGEDRPDVAFLAVHGPNAEDGAIQGLLELLHLPYTGSGVRESAVAMDKHLTKQILAAAGLPVPLGVLIRSPDEEIAITPPCIVKPNAQGSTVGLSFVREASELAGAVARAFRYDDEVVVEDWIEGMEVSVPVLGDRALPVVEIAPASGCYDFAAKYTPGATEEIIPARLEPAMTAKVQDYALRAHRALECDGATRTDFMVRVDEAFILELNTLPGMTGTSLLPSSARAAGISFEDLVDWMVRDALGRYAQKT